MRTLIANDTAPADVVMMVAGRLCTTAQCTHSVVPSCMNSELERLRRIYYALPCRVYCKHVVFCALSRCSTRTGERGWDWSVAVSLPSQDE
jgi:hypothetical protein